MSPKMERIEVGKKDSSDDTCSVYTNGGKLFYYDSCTSTFHPECLVIKVLEGS
jgi:hypothetical protein